MQKAERLLGRKMLQMWSTKVIPMNKEWYLRRFMLCVLFVHGLSCTKNDALTPQAVAPTMDFVIPFTIGRTWVYDHEYTYASYDMFTKTMRGVQIWQVMSVQVGPTLTTYSLNAFTRDTVYDAKRMPPDGAWWDTTYVSEQTIPFSAVVALDSINVGWLSMVQLGLGNRQLLERVPHIVPAGKDTLTLSAVDGLRNATYVTGLGLIKFTGYNPHAHASESETLLLRASW